MNRLPASHRPSPLSGGRLQRRAGNESSSPEGQKRCLVARSALLVGLLPVLAGCGLADFAGPTVVNTCGGDADCANGRCSVEFGHCVSEPVEGLRVGFDVAPTADPNGGGPTRSSFAEVALSTNAIVNLTLPQRRTVSGTIRHADEIVPADIVFTRASEFTAGPLVNVRASTAATVQPSVNTGSTVDYEVRLIAGATYAVEVSPTGDAIRDLPPLRASYTVPSTGSGGLDFVYDSELDAPCSTPTSTGCTFQGEVAAVASNLSETLTDGLQVRAIERASGRIVSSTALTGADLADGSGAFSLRIAPDASAYVFRVSAGPQQPFFASIDIDPATLSYSDTRPRIRVPELVPVRLKGMIVDKREKPIGGAIVTLTSTVVLDSTLGLEASFRTSTESRGDATATASAPLGSFEVDVLPGSYEIVVIPTGAQQLALQVGSVDVPPGAPTLDGGTYLVPDRSRLGGKLMVPTGEAMPSAMVVARAQGVETALRASLYNRTTESSSDATGRFDLPLDIGLFDMSLKPPADTYFPWLIITNLEIMQTGETWGTDYHTHYPVPVIGTVSAPDGTPLAQAEVRAYAITDEIPPRALLIGTAVSGDDGRYLLLVPPQLD